MTEKQVFELLGQAGAVLSGHFLLTSGKHSGTYIQCARLFERPEIAGRVCEALAQKLKNLGAELVASPAVGGIIMGYETARALGVPNIFFERQDGEMTLRRGFSVKEGAKVIVVEDVVTTGGSLLEVINKLQEMGADVVACAAVVDRSGGKASFPVPYVSLVSVDAQSFDADKCPLCSSGAGAPIKPGSRSLK